MKKFSYLLNVLLIGFIGFQSFKKNEKTIKPDQPVCDKICMNYPNVAKFKMNSNVLKMMSSNYYYGNAPVNHNTTNDAKSVWFSLTTLKTFIWQIENAVCNSNNPCKSADSLLGIRIYYARYPVNQSNLWPQYHDDLGTLLPAHANYAKQHTFFMVPTFDINGAHWDFDPFTASFNKKCIPDALEKTLGGSWKMSKESTYIPTTSGIMIAALAPNPDPAAKNHGELCPPYPNGVPPCPGAYFQ